MYHLFKLSTQIINVFTSPIVSGFQFKNQNLQVSLWVWEMSRG